MSRELVTKVGRDRLEVRRRPDSPGDGSVDRGPQLAFWTFLEIQRMRVSRIPAMTSAAMPESSESIRWTERTKESRLSRVKRQQRDRARRAQLRHEAQLAYAVEQMRSR